MGGKQRQNGMFQSVNAHVPAANEHIHLHTTRNVQCGGAGGHFGGHKTVATLGCS
jgi:hypothetical protein